MAAVSGREIRDEKLPSLPKVFGIMTLYLLQQGSRIILHGLDFQEAEEGNPSPCIRWLPDCRMLSDGADCFDLVSLRVG
jgi:hypothetical protein